ncbi:hypothetical protein L226DRAFT_574893 [Lentinus tigrinus ALCF2SS1-7]|uniref:DUF6534 domain-containing protein n=1 Tax=Lentinus tigrinus ALCF2SS1-6 TaxID=1328759 RepID=A0A5C2RUW0_9APHY|nr:hypothetical protein L227DRAFT_615569 [Lentinus tigrinus ALCF2SS1-6]RPD70374.1 hypothetical protein L226DRAFT_574893 [Lentinus tigrinus ALCF2SS1-7]
MATAGSVVGVLGAILVEVCLACMLFGATTIQSFIFFQTDASIDSSKYLKSLVGSIWILEGVHTAFCIQFVYAYTINHFGDYDYMDHISWGASATILVGAIVSLLVHSFYAKRIYTMGKSIYLPLILTILSLGCFACSIGSFVISLGHKEWIAFRYDLSPLVTVTVGLGCATAADIIIMLATTYFTRVEKQNGNNPPGNLVDTFLTYVVNTGAVAAIFSILTIVLFVTQRHNLVFFGFIEMQTKLYANSFLGTLNINAITPEATVGAIHPNTYKLTPRRSPQFRTHIPRTDLHPPQVTVMQETVVTRDDDGDFDDYKAADIGLAITADDKDELM